MKKRLDVLVYEKGFAESREKAKAIIMAGLVYVDNRTNAAPHTTKTSASRCAAAFFLT